MSDVTKKIVDDKNKELIERNLIKEKLKQFLYNFNEVINTVPKEMQSEFVIGAILSNDNFMNLNGLENATVEYDGIDTIVKSCGFLRKSPKSLLQLPKEISNVILCGDVTRFTRRKDNMIITTTTRMVNMSSISTDYALDFDKLEVNDGFDIGVIKKQLVLSKDSVISYSELNYVEKRQLKFMKWYGKRGFFTLVDDNRTRKPELEKAIKVLSDQDIILDSLEKRFDITSYKNTCSHLKYIENGEIAPLVNDRIRYLNVNYLCPDYSDAYVYEIEKDTLKNNDFMLSSKVKRLIPQNKCL